jgi:class 3 adenylate cyclase
VTTEGVALGHLRHELRTPLNHIIGYSELLLEELDGGPNASLIPDLQRVRTEAQTLLERINEALSPSRLARGRVDAAALSPALLPSLERAIAVGQELRARALEIGAQHLAPDLDRILSAADQLVSLVTHGVPEPSAEPRATVQASDAIQPDSRGGAILVVDDNDGNRDMLARHLARQGHEVRLASGGEQALEALAARPVDLVLLDVMMPGMDGYEVLRRLKADPGWRDIPVLMISALDELESVVRCIELGADDYLSKPFVPVLLRARIGACLEKKWLRDREVQHLAELAEWNRTLERRVEEQVTHLERLSRLKRFFSPQLAELIVAGGADDPLRSHRRDIAVLFVDLRGFTAFAETAEPEELMGVLREYHAALGALVVEYEGTLERFTGDGMMVFFNDPVTVPNPAERAVRMALAMRERVDALSSAWRKRGYVLGVGMGIAQGYATIGAIGFEGRWDYGAIGSVTNLAARLCAEARAGQILVSQRVLGMVEDLVDTEPESLRELRGFSRPVAAYGILGRRPA